MNIFNSQVSSVDKMGLALIALSPLLLMGCSEDSPANSRGSRNAANFAVGTLGEHPAEYNVLFDTDRVAKYFGPVTVKSLPRVTALEFRDQIILKYIEDWNDRPTACFLNEDVYRVHGVKVYEFTMLSKVASANMRSPRVARLDYATVIVSDSDDELGGMVSKVPEIWNKHPPQVHTMGLNSYLELNYPDIGRAISAMLQQNERVVGLRTLVIFSNVDFASNDVNVAYSQATFN